MNATERPTGTVTFLFTDIEGSTQLLRRLGDEYSSALSTHQRLVRDAVEGHGGLEVDTQGDAFFFAFQRASDAVQAAIDAQRSLAAYEWPEPAAIRVRMGLHTGAVRFEDGRYHGLPVHRAARIAAVAHGGQILISESTRSLLADEEELAGVAFRDLGPLQLKDFDRPIRVYRLAVAGLADVERRPRARPESRRTLLVGAGIVAVTAAAVAAALAMTLGGRSAPAHVSANSVAMIDPARRAVRSSVPVGTAPGSIALDSSAAWVANRGSSTVTRIDARTHATSTIGGFTAGVHQLAAGGGGLWVTERTAGVATVNVATLTVSPPVSLATASGEPYSAEAIAYGDGALWIGGGLPTGLFLLKVDPLTEKIVGSASVGVRSQHTIALGQGGVWVSDVLDNSVVEFDPRTLKVLRRIQIGGPAALALGGGALWVAAAVDKGVWRLDATSGYRTRHLIPVGGDPVAVAYGENAVWAALDDGTMVRIDARTNAVRRTKIASVLNAIAVGNGVVWAESGPVSFL